MSNYVTLVKSIRKDNNGNITQLDRRYMNIELLTPAVQGSAIILPNSTHFYISEIIQDLSERRVILVEFDDYDYTDFYNDEFYSKYLQKLRDEGWLDNKPKSIFPYTLKGG